MAAVISLISWHLDGVQQCRLRERVGETGRLPRRVVAVAEATCRGGEAGPASIRVVGIGQGRLKQSGRRNTSGSVDPMLGRVGHESVTPIKSEEDPEILCEWNAPYMGGAGITYDCNYLSVR